MLKLLYQLIYTECLLLLRQSSEWLYPIGFFMMVICLFPFAFSPDPAFLNHYLPGCMWIAALFANLLTLPAIFASDIEDSHLEQTLFTPTSFSLIITTKIFAHWLITSMPFILLAPILGMIFGLAAHIACLLMISLLLGTPIITLIGALAVALTFGLRQKGVLISLLILPLITPVLIFAMMLLNQAQSGFEIAGPLALLAGFCLLSVMVLPMVIAACVKIGLDD